jgi:ABC-2 type transport system permease protein
MSTNKVWTVARWEFFRYFKWKGELFTIGLILLLSVLSFSGKGLISKFSNSNKVTVAVIDSIGIEFPINDNSQFIFRMATEKERPKLMQQVADKEIAGILTIDELMQAQLLVFETKSWQNNFTNILNELVLNKRLVNKDINQTDFQALKAPIKLNFEYHQEGSPPSSSSEKIFVIIMLIMMLIGVLMSFSYIFISVTSEKQLRVTEQVISAISPQTWIDGKLIGLTAMSLKSVITSSLTSVFGIIVYAKFTNTPSLFTGFEGSVLMFSLIGAFGLLGLLFWNCFMVAVAAMVEDPNTSTKTPVMLLPILAVSLAFFAISEPTNIVVQILSLLPITSMGVMPVRMVMSTVPEWQIILSFIILVVAVIWTRIFASKIFRLSMLMYGKEPKWSEAWRWIRQS